MTLEKQDAELFYELWFPLLDFVNQKYRVCPGTGTIDRSRGVDAADAKKIADYLWSHTQVLQEYIAYAKLPEEQAQIVAGGGQCKPGKYIVERHLKKGTVFISEDDQTVYMVEGLFSTWEEMMGKGPVLLDAVLIPFKDMIISDGLVTAYPFHFGRGYSEAFKDIPVIFDEAYMEFGKESAVCLLKEYPNVFVCRTLSKAYGLAGIRCGFMISSQVEKLSALFIPYALSSVTQTIASVVLRHADEYKDTIATIISERERMYQEVKEFKQLTMYPSNANFLFGRSEKKDLLLAMFKEKNITIRNYEDASFRITIGTKEENEMVLDVLRRFEYANS